MNEQCPVCEAEMVVDEAIRNIFRYECHRCGRYSRAEVLLPEAPAMHYRVGTVTIALDDWRNTPLAVTKQTDKTISALVGLEKKAYRRRTRPATRG